MKFGEGPDQRVTLRHPLLGDLSGKIIIAATGKISRCLALDVSETGLKLMSFESMAPGTDLILRVDDKDIPLRVIWVSERQGDVEHFVCGVESLDRNQGLESLFVAKSWLSRKSS